MILLIPPNYKNPTPDFAESGEDAWIDANPATSQATARPARRKTPQGARWPMSKRQLRVVRLLEPDLCLECAFAQQADVETADGSVQRMLYCRRLDCDNWDYESAEPAVRVEVCDEETQ
ncbi:MAG: hypothetical protein DYH07_03575 [Armatimonadetes bacterium ATM1]|nr:MAG: hypothetical protein EDM73_04010 [Armatimonadota bacterium]MBC6969507.1 hypothetical protein [Armatimonadota bacterium]MCE7899155.1 hypothetical protein [Armatimonadetes bacterium ATM1]RIJ97222.1 MAG: hypothetical protein DCC45_04070 [Armatimonadota bacterium]